MIADFGIQRPHTFIECHDALVGRCFRGVRVATHDTGDLAQHRAVIFKPLVFVGADCVVDFHGDSEVEGGMHGVSHMEVEALYRQCPAA